MTTSIKLKKDSWCPLDLTGYEGYCVDHVAIIDVLHKECDHKEECLRLKEQLDAERGITHENQ